MTASTGIPQGFAGPMWVMFDITAVYKYLRNIQSIRQIFLGSMNIELRISIITQWIAKSFGNIDYVKSIDNILFGYLFINR